MPSIGVVPMHWNVQPKKDADYTPVANAIIAGKEQERKNELLKMQQQTHENQMKKDAFDLRDKEDSARRTQYHTEYQEAKYAAQKADADAEVAKGLGKKEEAKKLKEDAEKARERANEAFQKLDSAGEFGHQQAMQLRRDEDAMEAMNRMSVKEIQDMYDIIDVAVPGIDDIVKRRDVNAFIAAVPSLTSTLEKNVDKVISGPLIEKINTAKLLVGSGDPNQVNKGWSIADMAVQNSSENKAALKARQQMERDVEKYDRTIGATAQKKLDAAAGKATTTADQKTQERNDKYEKEIIKLSNSIRKGDEDIISMRANNALPKDTAILNPFGVAPNKLLSDPQMDQIEEDWNKQKKLIQKRIDKLNARVLGEDAIIAGEPGVTPTEIGGSPVTRAGTDSVTKERVFVTENGTFKQLEDGSFTPYE